MYSYSTIINREQTMPGLHDPTNRQMEEEERSTHCRTNSNGRPYSTSDFLLQQEVHIPVTTRSPLPLQCLAAEALPDGVKNEIEQITNNSLKEVDSAQENKQQEGDHISSPAKDIYTTLTVPLQLFTGSGLRIVGGIKCPYSGEKHAQIVTFKYLEEEGLVNGTTTDDKLPPSLHKGLCVVEMDGRSLIDASFEDVRTIMRSLPSPVVKIVVKDCRAQTNDKVSVTKEDKSVNSKAHNTTDTPTHFLTLRKQKKASAAAKAEVEKAKRKSEVVKRNEIIKGDAISSWEVSIEFSQDSKREHRKLSSTSKQSSTQSLNSLIYEPVRDENNLTNQSRMAKISLRYLKAQGKLCVNLHKLKYLSKNTLTDQSGVFLNAYIFPDKRRQGMQFCRMVSTTATAESLLENSAQYHLNHDELSNTSLRILIWENGGSMKSKKNQFRGEVFLSLCQESEHVNFEGVSHWYPLSQPDKNLPLLPPPHPPPNYDTLIKKVKASLAGTTSNFGTLTKRGKRDYNKNGLGSLPNLDKEITRASSLQKLPNISTILEPLKERSPKLSLQEVVLRRERSRRKCNSSRLSVFELSSGLAEEEQDGGTMERVPSTPNLAAQESPSSQRNLSLFEFLEGLNTPRTKARLMRFSQILDSQKSQSQELLRPPTSRPTSSISSSSSLSSNSLHFSASNFRDDTSSSGASDTSSLSSFGNNNNNRGVAPMKGWPENVDNKSPKPDNLEVGGVSKSPRHYSFMDSLENLDMGGDSPTGPHPSLVVNKSSTPMKKNKYTSDDGYDRLLPFVRINDDDPHRPRSLYGSTETLTPHSLEGDTLVKGRSRSWGERDTLSAGESANGRSLGSCRLSKSMNELSAMSYEDEDEDLSQSSLDLADFHRLPLSQESSLSSDSFYAPDGRGQLLERRGQPLESIIERSMEGNSIHTVFNNSHLKVSPSSSTGASPRSPRSPRRFRGAKAPAKRSVSMEVLNQIEESSKNALSPPVLPALAAVRKESKLGTISKLTDAYATGKPIGSVSIELTAKHIARTVTVKITDLVFINSQKLMNTDYTVKVNLFNRFNEKCEMSQKGVAMLKKNGMNEQKQFPTTFIFQGDPAVYYIQIQFQIRSRLFKRKTFHVFKDLDSLQKDKKDDSNIWLELRKLPSQ